MTDEEIKAKANWIYTECKSTSNTEKLILAFEKEAFVKGATWMQEEKYEEISELKKLGKKATELIAHLKDRYGFNEAEEKAQDELNNIFGYDGNL